MYWNNVWLNTFNTKMFFNKTLFLENIFYFLFSEKIFNFFFFNIFPKNVKNFLFFKSIVLKHKKLKQKVWVKSKNKKKKKIKYNFTRLWLIKFNNFILIATFVYFFFKTKKKKKLFKNKIKISKIIKIFWKKRKGWNSKRKFFKKNNYLVF